MSSSTSLFYTQGNPELANESSKITLPVSGKSSLLALPTLQAVRDHLVQTVQDIL